MKVSDYPPPRVGDIYKSRRRDFRDLEVLVYQVEAPEYKNQHPGIYMICYKYLNDSGMSGYLPLDTFRKHWGPL